MNFARFERQIREDEGYRESPYLDTVGTPTIGYGCTAIFGMKVSMDMPPITKTIARELLRADVYGALVDAQAIFPRFNELNSVRQEVLANMAYNLGRRRLSGFGRLKKAAQRLDYQAMADEMTDSKWFRQVGNRSKRLVEQMRTGEI